jgi:hypothetical protein
VTFKFKTGSRRRRGAPWSEQDDTRLLEIGHLPPKTIADLMGRSWLACRNRLVYLRTEKQEGGSQKRQA